VADVQTAGPQCSAGVNPNQKEEFHEKEAKSMVNKGQG